MSKQADAKKKQNYRPKPVWSECRHCIHFEFDTVTTPGSCGCDDYTEDKNLRCGLGGFKVVKLGTCDDFTAKESSADASDRLLDTP